MTNPHRHLRVEVDYDGRTDGQPVYIGYANPLSDTAKPVWQIMKIIYDGNDEWVQRLWADGDVYYDNVWDDRASLSYS